MLKLFNTLSKSLETFTPRSPGQVGLYTCGPTVYSTAHIGNLRTYIFEDVLRRTLEFNGYNVTHVMNITDVGHLTGDGDMGADKMEESAKKEKKRAVDIATFHTNEFFYDLEQLNIKRPTTILKATETIDLQITLIERLAQGGFTYKTSDGIYFDTAKFPRYGELSGQKSNEKKAGARIEVNDEKRNTTDFALWKFSKPEDHRQMEWPSPWGTGFPGWHIECSAMSMKELGDQFDIHTGGVDHIAVHHENEIAQSEAATGKHPFVKYWLHGEFLVLPERRMGKSEGNSITLETIIAKGLSPLSFRYLALQTHYKKPLSFSWESLQAASTGLTNLYNFIGKNISEPLQDPDVETIRQFTDAINDDLNTPQALAVAQVMIKNPSLKVGIKLATLEVADRIFGLGLTRSYAQAHFKSVEIIDRTGVSDELNTLLQQRDDARASKDWQKADELREKIDQAGYEIIDTDQGSELRKK